MISGIAPAQKIAGDSLEVIPGIELSAEIDSKEIHILGYFIDTQSLRLQNEIEKINKIRRERVFEMVDKLKKLGVDLKAEDVFKVSGQARQCCNGGQGSISRLHIATAMVLKGKVSNIYEAFSRYIGNKGPAYVGKYSLTPQDAIGLIKEAKGVAVLAHPQASNCDELIPGFVKAGLRGLEVYYPEHSQSTVNYYLQMANKHNLLVTGGSDCHGLAKPEVGVGKVAIPYELVERLKKECYGQ
jgi:predicted metal-dependent phosphoesterase TrpH